MDELSCILLCSLTDYDTYNENQRSLARFNKKSNISLLLPCMDALAISRNVHHALLLRENQKGMHPVSEIFCSGR